MHFQSCKSANDQIIKFQVWVIRLWNKIVIELTIIYSDSGRLQIMSNQLILPHYLGFNHFLIFPSRCVVSFFLLDCLILYSKVEPSISYIFKVFFEVIVFIQMLKRKISQGEMVYRSVATAKSCIFEVIVIIQIWRNVFQGTICVSLSFNWDDIEDRKFDSKWWGYTTTI